MLTSEPLSRKDGSPFPAARSAQLLLAGGIVAAMILWLMALGRDWVCPCGTVRLWQSAAGPAENSQHFADWYSLLHVVFGLGLAMLVRRTAPQWPQSAAALTALASSAFWEAAENTPAIIALFGRAPQMPAYLGDSILNACGDTLFVMAGFFLAWRLPAWAVAVVALTIEAAVTLAIRDGLVLGTLRLLGLGA